MSVAHNRFDRSANSQFCCLVCDENNILMARIR